MPKLSAEARLEAFYAADEEDVAKITRQPVHVVYGGAHLYRAEIASKFGRLALASLKTYAPDAADFASVFGLATLENQSAKNKFLKLATEIERKDETFKEENLPHSLALTVYRRTLDKLHSQPVEDFRIDFEDGYGFRTDAEEDSHALAASSELARAFVEKTITPFCGFRIKSLQKQTYRRALRTLRLFISNLLANTGGKLPANFCVTLPKIKRAEEIAFLCDVLDEIETEYYLIQNSIRLEIMIETPQAFFNAEGQFQLPALIAAGRGRINSAHFGAFDYTANFNITGDHQDLRHEACDFARQLMLIGLAPLGIRLSDSVTVQMPVPVFRGDNLTSAQQTENKNAVWAAWHCHFENVEHALRNGFFQGWDLHPAQLVARYAALFHFFLKSADSQAERLRGFAAKATQANLTGNTFDDAASVEGLLNFFRLGAACGAFTGNDIEKLTGFKPEQLTMQKLAEIH